MERLAQYLDDLEDIFFAIGLQMEGIRRAFCLFFVLITSFIIQFCAVLLALSRPPLALAVLTLVVVGILYRGVTANRMGTHSAS